MTLEFPNSSRSFDASRKAIRFVGHDGMSEVRFFIEANALPAPGQPANDEDAYLSAFDAARNEILNAARRAYSSNQRNSVTLTVADLR